MPELVFTWRTYPWKDMDKQLRVHQERVRLTPETVVKLYHAWSRASLGGCTQVVELGDIEVRFTYVGPNMSGHDRPWNLDGASCVAACSKMPYPSRTLKRRKWARVVDVFRSIDVMDHVRILDRLHMLDGTTGKHAWGGAGQKYQAIE